MRPADMLKSVEKPHEYTLSEVSAYLHKLQKQSIFGKIELTFRNGKVTYVHRSHGMNPGEPLE